MKKPLSAVLSALLVFAGLSGLPASLGAATFTPATCVPDGLLAHMENEFDSRISGVTAGTSTMSLWLTRGDATSPWVWNPDVWTSNGTTSVDWTGLSPWNGTGGYTKAGALVSPRHLVFANHYPINAGATVVFVEADGDIVTRTLVGSQRVSDSDILVGVLDSDVPETITHYPVLGSGTWESYLRDGIDDSLYGLPMVAFDQEDHAIIRTIAKSSPYSGSAFFHSYGNGARLAFDETIIDGDSGNPAFTLIGGKPVLLLTHYSATAGPSYSHYRDEINSVMTSLGGGHQLSDVDLSCFDAPIVIAQSQGFTTTSRASVGTTVGTIDLEYNVDGAAPYFTIVSGNDDGALALATSTGVMTIASSSLISTAGGFPRSVGIKASKGSEDGRASYGGVAVSISLTVQFPTGSYAFEISETAAASASVGTVLATHPDNVPVTHAISSGNGDGVFAIDASTGVITVSNPSSLNADVTPSYSLTVSAAYSSIPQSILVTVPVTVSVEAVARPTVAFASASGRASEGTTHQILVALSSIYGRDVTVPYTVTAGSALASSDYSLSSGSVTIPAGQTSAVISATISSDSASESDEAFSVHLGTPTRASLGQVTSYAVTIENVQPAVQPSSRRGGGGGGGGSSSASVPSVNLVAPASTATTLPVADLIRMFVQMNPQLAALLGISSSGVATQPTPAYAPTQVAAPGSLASCPDMEVGSTGQCVRMLQEFLNGRGFTVSAAGAGSRGLETTYFGPATSRALSRFQATSGVFPASGYFGPRTRTSLGSSS